jgi:predicted Zn-ribbon and HTH transcriptional regulator
MTAKQKKTGRPQGATTAERDLVDVPPSRCARCESTKRTPYYELKRIEGQGHAPDGRPYTAVILRPTRCLDCGQHRYDRSWEFSADETVCGN